MQNFWSKLTVFGFLLLAFGGLMADSSWAQNKGGGKGGGGGSDPPPPPPSPLKYRLYLSAPLTPETIPRGGAVNTHGVYVNRHTNSAGMVEALLVDATGIFGQPCGTYPLSQLVHPNTLPQELSSSQFLSVNDRNQVVGWFSVSGSNTSRSFVLDLSNGRPGSWRELIPEGVPATHTQHRVVHVNERGIALIECTIPLDGTIATERENLYNRRMYLVDVVDGASALITLPTGYIGTANAWHGEAIALNDNGQVAWIQTAPNQEHLNYADRTRWAYLLNFELTSNEQNFALEPTEVLEVGHSRLLQVSQLSDLGTCAGYDRVTIAARPRPIITNRATRTFFDPIVESYTTHVFGTDSTIAQSINGEGDILVFPQGGVSTPFRGFLYVGVETPLPDGLSIGPDLDIKNLIQVDAADQQFWNDAEILAVPLRLSHRDGTGFGKVAGRVHNNARNERRLFVLVPEVTP